MGDKRGIILGITLIYTVVFTLLGYGLLTLANFDKIEVYTAIRKNQALYVAEAGMERLKAMGQQTRQPYNQILTYDPFHEEYTPITGAFGSGTYRVTIQNDPARDNMHNVIQKYLLFSRASVGISPNIMSTTLSMRATTQTFASYAYASNLEHAAGENPIWFVTGDHITGSFYTNDYIYVSGKPIFDGLVKSSKDSIKYLNGGPPTDVPDFKQGIELGVPALKLSEIFDPPSRIQPIMDAAGATTSFQGATTIQFLSDGTMNVTNTARGWTTPYNMSLPSSEAIYVNGDATVYGVIHGKVTIAAENNIKLPNNVTYAYPSNPLAVFDPGFNEEDPYFTDSLGLIAKNDVVITKPYNSADKDITIHAVVLATKGSFTAQEYATRTPGGKINLYGGISQYERGPVGTFSSGGGISTGFLKNYKYNEKVFDYPPRYFPYSGYSFDQWSQSR